MENLVASSALESILQWGLEIVCGELVVLVLVEMVSPFSSFVSSFDSVNYIIYSSTFDLGEDFAQEFQH